MRLGPSRACAHTLFLSTLGGILLERAAVAVSVESVVGIVVRLRLRERLTPLRLRLHLLVVLLMEVLLLGRCRAEACSRCRVVRTHPLRQHSVVLARGIQPSLRRRSCTVHCCTVAAAALRRNIL